jgi:hypothetical protein
MEYTNPQSIANALWQLLPEVSNTAAIYAAVEYLENVND